MKQKAWIVIKSLLILYAVLFLGRLIVLASRESRMNNPAGAQQGLGLVLGAVNQELNSDSSTSFASSPRNLARYEYKAKPQAAAAPLPALAGTHYERVASLGFQTRRFEEDEKKLRDLVLKYKAVVQAENRSGLEGHRSLALSLGVTPENFDAAVEELQKLSRLTGISIEKTDRTQEFKELMATRISLKKKRDALEALKAKGGKITEFVELEDKIFEIEKEVQGMGVKIGGFESGVDLCTVRVSLAEAGKRRAFLSLVIEAAEWAFWASFQAAALAFGFALLIGAIAGIWYKTEVLGKPGSAPAPAVKSRK